MPEISKELAKFIQAIEEGTDYFFSMSPKFDENKVFLRTWGEITNRLDPNYYKKVYMDLEEAVAKLTKYKLRDFIQFMASGVTPKITEYDKYYSDSTNGVPFLRVQNLSPEGLNWSDCKYINKETHNQLLKRSQVFEGDLLIKITGVGRMAVTSIAPEEFEGNINQHMVVVKTKSPELNEQIAAFLNSDIGEMLATHRSTGGTRPALDYSALRSIPIILNDTISNIMEQAYKIKKEKEREVQILLESIDNYLLQEFGIAIPIEEEDTLERRTFYVSSSNVLGSRFDSFYHKPIFNINLKNIVNGKNLNTILKKVIVGELTKGILPNKSQKGGEYKVVQINNIGSDGTIEVNDNITAKSIYLPKHKLEKGDVLIVITGATIGKIGFWDYEGEYYLGGDIVKFNTGNYYLNEIYAALLKTKPYQLQIKRCITGATNGHLALRDVELLPLPDIIDKEAQKKISTRLSLIRLKVQLLKQEIVDVINLAKEEVEKILLRGDL